MWTDAIEKPTLVLDAEICRANIKRMADRAKHNHVKFRPHSKTHQSSVVSGWLREVGNVDAITVSSVEMATYFAQHGWKDITIAFTVNTRQIKEIDRLAGQIKLGVIVESIDTVRCLQERLKNQVQVWLDIDTGYHRTGMDWQASSEIIKVAQGVRASEITHLAGLLVHPGHTYKAKTHAEVHTIHQETVERMNQIRDLLAANNITGLAISTGCTPSCSMVEDLGNVDEIRPGNFVFYDVMQASIGANRLSDVAVVVACPVVAKHPHLQQIVVYGGAVHLSKDRIIDSKGRTCFGLLAKATATGWEAMDDTCYVKGLSQEHGLIHADAHLLETVNVGDILLIFPIHSCLAANLLKRYHTLDGGVITMAPIPNVQDPSLENDNINN